jgi:hypothetical protein
MDHSLIAQIWRGVTRATDRDACVAQLLAAIHTALVDCTLCKGAYVLSRPTDGTDVELMVLSLFRGAGRISSHDGAALYRAAVFARPLPLALDGSVAIYEVLTEPHRTLSHANLRRRFPLRLMAPR